MLPQADLPVLMRHWPDQDLTAVIRPVARNAGPRHRVEVDDGVQANEEIVPDPPVYFRKDGTFPVRTDRTVARLLTRSGA